MAAVQDKAPLGTRQSGQLPQRQLPDDPPPDQISTEDALAEAKAELEAERRRASDAEAREREAQVRAHTAETRVTEASGAALTAQERQLEAALSAEQARLTNAKAALTAAFNAQDGVAVADAQAEIADATAAIRQHNTAKQWFENEKARQAEEARRAPPQHQQGNLVQVRTPGGNVAVSPQTKQWMDQHSRFYEDKAYYNAALQADSTLVADGIQRDTPAYYRGLDEQMKQFEEFEAYRRGETMPADPPISQRQQQRRSLSPVSPPPGRSTTPRSSSNSAPTWRDAARIIGGDVNETDLREYARINGYKGDAGFEQYLSEIVKTSELERSGESTGMIVDSVYR